MPRVVSFLGLGFVLLLNANCATRPASTTQPAGTAAAAPTKTFSIPVFDAGQKPALIDLPGNYVREVANGADFDVIYFRANATEGLGIYIGGHPGLFSPQAEGAQVSKIAATINGNKVEWLEWGKPGEFHAETLVSYFYGPPTGNVESDYYILHVFVFSPTAAGRKQLEAAAATLRLEKKSP